MRRFYLQRDMDVSGVSGTGKVAEGCQHDDGHCSFIWLSDTPSLAWYPSIKILEKVHGHGGAARVVWIDDESHDVVVSR